MTSADSQAPRDALPTSRYARLHLGCGSKYFEGWFHVDALDYPHVDHIGPVEDLPFIPDGVVEIAYACHLLEHFGRKEYMDVLREWRRVLRPGGVLRLAVPDYRACAEFYLAGTPNRESRIENRESRKYAA